MTNLTGHGEAAKTLIKEWWASLAWEGMEGKG